MRTYNACRSPIPASGSRRRTKLTMNPLSAAETSIQPSVEVTQSEPLFDEQNLITAGRQDQFAHLDLFKLVHADDLTQGS